MNCTDLLSHLSDYFDEQLSPKLLEEIRTHTAGCQHCKVVLDTTNPIAEKAPVHGVVAFFTGPNDSLLERLQARVPKARFVKAFSSVGAGLMVNPNLSSKPTMFICGNDNAAKELTRSILDAFGWETEDAGMAEAARAIEPLCMLWCIPGFLRNDWAHALKVLR